jgi:low temperature requirement protein LtrA
VTAFAPVESAPSRVSTLELFFDLVFVYTITQVTEIIVEHPDGGGLARAAVVLSVIFWMYGGYAWLTNASGPDTTARRIVLLAGAAGFFLVSLCVPDAFGANGVAFGLAYLAVNLVHGAGFVVFAGRGALQTIAPLVGLNVLSAGLILAAGWAHGAADWPWWLAALAVQLSTPALTRPRGGYRINVDHFSERHGLVVLIVLGESLVSIALSGRHDAVTLRTALGVLAGLLAAATVWWAYFVGEDSRAAAALEAVGPERRPTLAVVGYFYAHLVIIYGILLLAAGIRLATPDLTGPLAATPAWLIAAGGAIYLAGSAAFRRALRFGDPWPRLVGGLVCLVTVPIGVATCAAVELVALAAVLAGTVALDSRTGSAAGRGRLGRVGRRAG